MKNWKRILIITLSLMSAIMLLPQEAQAASWKKNNVGWWYREDDGSYPQSEWKMIGGKWYYFDARGYMVTGWCKVNGRWYFMDSSGAMTTGWQKVNGKWYFMDSSGAMTTGWQKVYGKWYFMNGSGAMTTGWQKVNGKYYYMNSSGAMMTGWQKIGNYWYYMNADGHMATSTWIGKYYVDANGRWVTNAQPAKWMHDSGGWWYRHSDGSRSRSAWEKIKDIWYYFNGSGYMVTGWNKINGTWYYMHASGAMAHDAWAGDYYLLSSGAMATNQWIGDYYVGADGKWIPNYQNGIKGIKVTGFSKMKAGAFQFLVVACDPGKVLVTSKSTFKSSDENIATVDALGKVTAVKDGTVTITATYEQFTKDFTITVEKIPVETVTIGGEGQMYVGQTRKVFVFVTPLNATYREDVVYTSSDETVATVDAQGNVTAVAATEPTNVTITATVDGVSNSMTITVNPLEDVNALQQDESAQQTEEVSGEAAKAQLETAMEEQTQDEAVENEDVGSDSTEMTGEE